MKKKKYINIEQANQLPKLFLRRKFLRWMIQLLVLIGSAMIYYIVFSLVFDTPIEYQLKKTNRNLEEQFTLLSERYDMLEQVLDDVVARDRNIHRMVFESDPYSDETATKARLDKYEKFLTMTREELKREFAGKLGEVERMIVNEHRLFDELQEKMIAKGEKTNDIPSIQPVNNKELNKLATSYGMRIHPFYKTMVSHQGVDYALAENSRVYATADGVVKDEGTQTQTKGLGILIAHGNGYETYYAHLNRINVRKGEKVRRGDIIGLSGNTGLSLAPHLHYEVRLNGMRIDPVNYFFLELNPSEYKKLREIALSSMQSFD